MPPRAAAVRDYLFVFFGGWVSAPSASRTQSELRLEFAHRES